MPRVFPFTRTGNFPSGSNRNSITQRTPQGKEHGFTPVVDSAPFLLYNKTYVGKTDAQS